MSKIAEALFSKATQTILDLIFMSPQGIHLRGLTGRTGLSSASAQRELGKLTAAGILEQEHIGRVILYKPNTASPIYEELNAILRKTAGAAGILSDALMPFRANIELAFIYGSVAKNLDTAHSDIDLLLVSDQIGSAELYPGLMEAEAALQRKVSLSVYRPAEFQRKLDSRNHFLATVMAGPKIALIG
jgi:predicted nucleotidyltransferase